MRDAEVHPDAECRRGMRDSGEEGRGELEMGPGSRTEWGGWRSRFRMPHSSSAFCIGVKFRIPHSSRLSPLFHSKAPGLRDGLCESHSHLKLAYWMSCQAANGFVAFVVQSRGIVNCPPS